MGASVGSDCIAAGMHADYVVRSRRVFTSVPGEREPHELAFAVSGDRIVLSGAPKDVLAAVPTSTPVHNWGDRFVCPGFHDAHLHFFHTAVGSSPFMLMHMGESEAELVARTRELATGPHHARSGRAGARSGPGSQPYHVAVRNICQMRRGAGVWH